MGRLLALAAGVKRALILLLGISLLAAVEPGTSGLFRSVWPGGMASLAGSPPVRAALLARTSKLASGQAGSCHHERGPFHVTGAAVRGSTGRYIPYGINIVGLGHSDYQNELAADEAQIAAAARYWCANTVRLQVGQANLVSTTGRVNQTFLAAVTREVNFAEARGLVVVLNLQWQLDPQALTESMPTRRSEDFWGSLAYHFGKDPNVVFDIYNEPEQFAPCGWTFWHDGGTCRGHYYIGMQALADFVRARASNMFWIEGISAGSLLTDAWQNRIVGDGPLEYSEHHPPAPHQPKTWNQEFGYIANSGHAPVVVGEWSDYARTDAPWACWDNAPVSVPRFLTYLQNHKFGVIAHKLVEGFLIESTNLDDPTHYRANWACQDGLDEGAGYTLQRWFYRQNG